MQELVAIELALICGKNTKKVDLRAKFKFLAVFMCGDLDREKVNVKPARLPDNGKNCLKNAAVSSICFLSVVHLVL